MKYFDFTRRDKIGVISLSVVILILTAAVQYRPSVDAPYSLTPDTTGIEYIPIPEDTGSFLNESYTSSTYPKNQINSLNYFDFDPNILGTEGWVDLGFTRKQSEAIINYREKFGTFKVKEDLKNVYVISDDKYNELEPFIKINVSNLNLIKINLATKEELMSIKGIGNVFADRIIDHRTKLGGFYKVAQLKEVYGIEDELYEKLKREIEIDEENIHRININSASKKELKKHPYVTFEMLAEILKAREIKSLDNLNFLVDHKIASQEQVEKLKPYIIY